MTDHDRLVVTSVFGGFRLGLVGKESSEGSSQGRASKFVVESSRTNRGFKHDIKTGGIVGRPANVDFPRLFVSGNQEVRNPETAEACLGRGTSSNSAFITNFASTTCGCTGERRNSSWVVVGLDFDQRLNNLLCELPATCGVIRSPIVSLIAIEAIVSVLELEFTKKTCNLKLVVQWFGQLTRQRCRSKR